jgi:hypothetical protein
VSEGLKKKIQEKAKTINELEKILYQKSRYTSREFIYEKDKQETWVTVDDVNTLLDEATKQIQEMMVVADLEHTHPSPEFWKGWNKAIDTALAVLDGKEKAKP